MNRFASAIFLILIACGKPSGGAETTAYRGIQLTGRSPEKLSTGHLYDTLTKSSCTILGTNVQGAEGIRRGLSSLHCWNSVFSCTNKTITWSDGKTAKCENVTAVAGQGSGDYVFIEFSEDRILATASEGVDAGEYDLGGKLQIRRYGEKEFRTPRRGELWQFTADGLCEPLEIRITQKKGFIEMSFDPLTGCARKKSIIVQS